MAIQPTALRHRTVQASTGMTLLAETIDISVDADFQFTSRDPFAVRVIFSVASAPVVEWVFARELLVDGLVAPAGTGDVQVFPTRAGIVFELTSPSGRARLVADPEVLASSSRKHSTSCRWAASRSSSISTRRSLMLADITLPGASQS